MLWTLECRCHCRRLKYGCRPTAVFVSYSMNWIHQNQKTKIHFTFFLFVVSSLCRYSHFTLSAHMVKLCCACTNVYIFNECDADAFFSLRSHSLSLSVSLSFHCKYISIEAVSANGPMKTEPNMAHIKMSTNRLARRQRQRYTNRNYMECEMGDVEHFSLSFLPSLRLTA